MCERAAQKASPRQSHVLSIVGVWASPGVESFRFGSRRCLARTVSISARCRFTSPVQASLMSRFDKGTSQTLTRSSARLDNSSPAETNNRGMEPDRSAADLHSHRAGKGDRHPRETGWRGRADGNAAPLFHGNRATE